jgi:hypothetical protein
MKVWVVVSVFGEIGDLNVEIERDVDSAYNYAANIIREIFADYDEEVKDVYFSDPIYKGFIEALNLQNDRAVVSEWEKTRTQIEDETRIAVIEKIIPIV